MSETSGCSASFQTASCNGHTKVSASYQPLLSNVLPSESLCKPRLEGCAWASRFCWLQGWTPLHCAAQGGKTDLVDLLLSHGADACAADAEVSSHSNTLFIGFGKVQQAK